MRFRVLAIASLITLAGCHLQADAPEGAPSGVAVAPGEGQVTVTWKQEPGLTYWIFFQRGSSVVPAATGVPLIFGATSPRVVAGLVNDTPYAFIMNSTRDDSKAGPSSPIVLATPRLAGAEWATGATLGTAQDMNGIAFSGSRLVAVGNSATIVAGDYNYASANPPVTAWLPATAPTGFTADLSAVTFSTQFVAMGADGSILTSADGLTWTPPSNATNPVLSPGMNGIAFGFVSGVGTYVVVGDGGAIFTSTDLGNWTPRMSGTVRDLLNISVLNGSFVVTGAGGTLLTSTDGSSWIAQDSKTTTALRGAAFRATPALYVVVGDAGTVVTSTDGINWAATTIGAQNLRGVTSGGALGSRFLAVGLLGTVVFSDDGASWPSPSVPPPGSPDLARVIFTPAMYVAVGAAGTNAFSK